MIKYSNYSEKEYPRVLVISYNCFSHGGSNGRTLANLFEGWDKNSVAQIYMSREIPDNDVCLKYFRITDIDVLNSFRFKKTSGKVELINKNGQKENNNQQVNEMFDKMKHSKSKIKIRLLRSLLWNMGFWKTSTYYKWIKDFNPDIILSMAGENYFVDKIALDVSTRLDIPLVVYNSENYQFKDYSRHGILGKVFKGALVSSYNKLMARTSHVIFLNKPLLELFHSKYPIESSVIYNPSLIEGFQTNNNDTVSKVSYLGRIEGRHESLVKIAEILRKIDNSLVLDLYGKITNDEVRNMIKNCNAIKYHGVVDYSEVINVISNSDLLIHCESFDEDEIIDKEYAFSTKISDSLASGKCFFVLAPESNAAAKYLIENKAACVVTNLLELEKNLNQVIKDKNLRNYYTNNALKLVEKNHDIRKNAKKIFEILDDTLMKRKR